MTAINPKEERPSHRRGTLAYFKLHTWGKLNSRTVNGSAPSEPRYIAKGIRLEISREDFYAWCDQRWPVIDGYYKQGETPSIDRRDSKGHYSLDNLQIISHRENSRRGGQVTGDLLRARLSKPIVGVSLLDPEKTVRFSSLHEAERNGFHHGNISSCLTGKRLSSGGFKWSYDTLEA